MTFVYQITDWDKYFENDRSRVRERCSFVCVPNKQHGMGFSYIMSQPDGLSIYGAFQLMLGACSQQSRPRHGWLTFNGERTGKPWGPGDMAMKFRRTEGEMSRALEVLCSEQVGWIRKLQVADSKENPPTHLELTMDSPSSPHQLTTDSPSTHLEEKRREEKRNEGKGNEKGSGESSSSDWIASEEQKRLNKLFRRRDGTRWNDRELKAYGNILPIDPQDFKVIEEYYTAMIPKTEDFRRRDLVTLLNNWNGEVDRANAYVKTHGSNKHTEGF